MYVQKANIKNCKISQIQRQTKAEPDQSTAIGRSQIVNNSKSRPCH